jgi:hypothetical protein
MAECLYLHPGNVPECGEEFAGKTNDPCYAAIDRFEKWAVEQGIPACRDFPQAVELIEEQRRMNADHRRAMSLLPSSD